MKSCLTTLCYIEKDDSYLMLHRIVKKNDVNKDKWIGIGGHFEQGESPEECLLREAEEETGLILTSYQFRGIVTFLSDDYPPEYLCLFTADAFEGDMIPCEEGVLEWVPKQEVEQLNLWEGDHIFLNLIREGHPFFSLKLKYENNVLKEAVLDGRAMELIDIRNPDGTVTGRVRERTLIHRDGDLHGTSHVWIYRKHADQGHAGQSHADQGHADQNNTDQSFDLLLQKRACGKDAFPGCYDISSAGHIPAGNDYASSAVRELGEELGIHADTEELHFLGMYESRVEREFYGRPFRNHEISAVYLLEKSLEPDQLSLQEEEVEQVVWMDIRDIRQGIEEKTLNHCILTDELDMLEKYLSSLDR
ncbi:NUDIX domain-containing protein [Diplocloster hominis]|uniref:NUDIX domain-containing protein n=1 Tax=Diplocloster hominis TaxID=3079010 RepID=UPI0031BA701D